MTETAVIKNSLTWFEHLIGGFRALVWATIAIGLAVIVAASKNYIDRKAMEKQQANSIQVVAVPTKEQASVKTTVIPVPITIDQLTEKQKRYYEKIYGYPPGYLDGKAPGQTPVPTADNPKPQPIIPVVGEEVAISDLPRGGSAQPVYENGKASWHIYIKPRNRFSFGGLTEIGLQGDPYVSSSIDAFYHQDVLRIALGDLNKDGNQLVFGVRPVLGYSFSNKKTNKGIEITGAIRIGHDN